MVGEQGFIRQAASSADFQPILVYDLTAMMKMGQSTYRTPYPTGYCIRLEVQRA
jgi:hypothetical protein